MKEEKLWWELDKIATKESGVGGKREKAEAAANVMKHLQKPTHEQCLAWFREENHEMPYSGAIEYKP